MSMEKVISYVNTNRGNGQKVSLSRMYRLLEYLGNPQEHLNFVHITGTNGKGSTASMLQAVFKEAGLDVGLFTSPHLEVINERIRLNNHYITDDDLIRLVNKVEPIVLQLETELNEKFYAFEILTAVAFLYFQEMQPDIIILEAGIGGRLDATNVITSADVAIITSIELDHMSVLGNTKEKIMNEKVQILKENGSLIVGPIEDKLKEIALSWGEKVNGDILFVNKKDFSKMSNLEERQVFDYQNWKDIEISLLGKHQAENAALVIEACNILQKKGYPIADTDIYKGLSKSYWPGRFEKIFDKPLFYIDGAHNIAGVNRLFETLEDLFPEKKFHFIIGMMKDKKYEAMIEIMLPLAKEFILISPDLARGFDAEQVAQFVRANGVTAIAKDDVSGVLSYIQNEIPKEDIVIQFGSLYLVGDIKRALEN